MYTMAATSMDTEHITMSFRDDLRAANQACTVAARKNNVIEEESTHCSSSDGDKQLEESPVHRTFAQGGEQHSRGSVNHPDACTPCAFYCFRKVGCPSGEGCDYCHMGHESKSRNRREEWKRQQTERRRGKRGFKGDVELCDSNKVAGAQGAWEPTSWTPPGLPNHAFCKGEVFELCNSNKRAGAHEVFELTRVSALPTLSGAAALNLQEPCFIAVQHGRCALYQ